MCEERGLERISIRRSSQTRLSPPSRSSRPIKDRMTGWPGWAWHIFTRFVRPGDNRCPGSPIGMIPPQVAGTMRGDNGPTPAQAGSAP